METPQGADLKYAVMIPCRQEEFADFISGLLGKPQTFGRVFADAYELTRRGVVNTFHLVDQRVRQQNEAVLIQFTVRISYDDNSSVLLNSFEDFTRYNEVRPLISVGAHLMWTYLIRFADRKVPEKQQIDITFSAGMGGTVVSIEEDPPIFEESSWLGRGHVATRISHTARTWGVDIDSLLEGHIKSLARPQGRLRKWTTRHSGNIGLGAGVLFLVITITAGYLSAGHFLRAQLGRVQDFLLAHGGSPAVSEKLDFLLQLAAEGSWPRFAFVIGGFSVGALILSVLFGILVGTTADNRLASFVLLSEKAEVRKQTLLDKEKRKWLSFIGSVITGILIGVLGNVVFSISLAKWLTTG